MGRNSYFQFKQFRINQERSAMKVGTDGVLLGAWADISFANNILDIGTGTGVVALMLAQRTTGKVTGIEIEKNAAAEAAENAHNSPWNNRLTIRHISFQDFLKTSPGKFDLVVTNPPYFVNNQKTADPKRSIARHNDLLPFSDLVNGVRSLLHDNGKFCIILPADPARKFVSFAAAADLKLTRLTGVLPKPDREITRWLMEFRKTDIDPVQDSLIIHKSDSSDFTAAYKKLTAEFYLKF